MLTRLGFNTAVQPAAMPLLLASVTELGSAPGKLRRAVLAVVLQVAAPEQRMLAGAIQLVIEFGDVGVLIGVYAVR